MDLKSLVAEKTRVIRYGIIRALSPSLYREYLNPTRPMTSYVQKVFGRKPLIGVEIGVGFGLNAKNILRTLNMKMLYLIDPYIPYDDGDTPNTKVYLNGLEIVKKELAVFPNITFIHKTSEDAVNDVPSEIDFCYIDGNHNYEYVKKDIENYYPKIKSGGVIGGHDFSVGFIGVCKAVIDFATKYQLKLYGKRDDWWTIKP
jgi:hypothetical protein